MSQDVPEGSELTAPAPSALSGVKNESVEADRFLIHARALVGVAAYATSQGCSQAQIEEQLKAVGLSDVRMDAYDCFIPLNRFGRLLQRFAKLLDDEGFGLAVGLQTEAQTIGVLGKAVDAAPNFESSLNVLTEYMRLYADVSFASLSIDDERAEYSWSYSPILTARDFICDRSARLFVSFMQRQLGPDIFPLEVHLQRTPPENPALFRAALGNQVTFDAPANRVVMRRKDLDRPNRNADAAAYEMARVLADRMMAERRIPDNFSIRVREDIMVHLADQGPDMHETARRLGLSARSLQRRLEELETSFQKVADEVRMASAQELLQQTSLPISEIAYRLGFANQANLTRAAKRWFGLSPKAVRRAPD